MTEDRRAMSEETVRKDDLVLISQGRRRGRFRFATNRFSHSCPPTSTSQRAGARSRISGSCKMCVAGVLVMLSK